MKTIPKASGIGLPPSRDLIKAQRMALQGDLSIDARRVAWISSARTLIAADLHLGYSWVQRQRGQLLPLGSDTTVQRLGNLVREYQARQLVILGDVVHAALPVAPLIESIQNLLQVVQSNAALVFILGNHDLNLPPLIESVGIRIPCVRHLEVGEFWLGHGDVEATAPRSSKFAILGHEHPAIELGDGVASRIRCPAFVTGPNTLILPAFSDWSSGTLVRPGGFIGPIAKRASFEKTIACLGSRLLPLSCRVSSEASEPPNGL